MARLEQSPSVIRESDKSRQDLAHAKGVFRHIHGMVRQYAAEYPKESWPDQLAWHTKTSLRGTYETEGKIDDIDLKKSMRSLISMFGDISARINVPVSQNFRKDIARHLFENFDAFATVYEHTDKVARDDVRIIIELLVDTYASILTPEERARAESKFSPHLKDLFALETQGGSDYDYKLKYIVRSLADLHFSDTHRHIIDVMATQAIQNVEARGFLISTLLEKAFSDKNTPTEVAAYCVAALAKSCSLDGPSLLDAWMEGSKKAILKKDLRNPQYELEWKSDYLQKNLARMCHLQYVTPGLPKWLVSKRNVRNFARYREDFLQQQFLERNTQGPYYILAVAGYDHNGAQNRPNDYAWYRSALGIHGVGLRLMEAATLDDLVQTTLAIHAETPDQKIRGMILAAHANSRLIRLSKKKNGDITKNTITVSDALRHRIEKCFESNPQLLIHACLVGKRYMFLAKGIAQLLAEKLGFEVHGARKVTRWSRVLPIGLNGRFSMEYDGNYPARVFPAGNGKR